jgi:serine protease AprX
MRYSHSGPFKFSSRMPLGVSAVMLGMVLLSGMSSPEGHGHDSKIGSILRRALDDSGSIMRRDDGTFAVWVYFTDHGLSGGARDVALMAVEQSLPERTLQRRAKMRKPGERLVDAADLPVSAVYLQAVRAVGAKFRHQSRWLNAAGFEADEVQLTSIAALSFVQKIELIARFRRMPSDPTEDERAMTDRLRAEVLLPPRSHGSLDYGGSLPEVQQINVPAVHEMGLTGQGVVLGMLDTGWILTHDAFADIDVLATWDFINDNEIVENQPGDSPSQHNHGTWTLSTVAGFKPGELVGPAFGAGYILAKTEDTSQEAPIEEDWWVAGLEWVELLGADIVSSSLGYYDWYGFPDLDGNTAVTTIAADMAVDRGVVVVNSAGNSRTGFGHIIAPADGHGVIAVGAVGLDGSYASFSSPGPTYDGRTKPDVMALGVGNHVVSISDDQGYVNLSGTSLSCPLVAGVAALMLQRVPGLTPLQVREALRETADRAFLPDNDYGWGIVDALAAATYWGAVIAHEPLEDTEDAVGPYIVSADITGRLPPDPLGMFVLWRADDGPWYAEPLMHAAADLWQAPLPGQESGTTVSYYLEVADSADVVVRHPFGGSAAPHAFLVDSATPSTPSGIPTTRLVANVPNPFNPRTTVVFELADDGPVRLEVFDLRGRRVRGLLAADSAAGRHWAIWDGRDDAGREVAAGVYHVRLTTGRTAQSLKLSLVR